MSFKNAFENIVGKISSIFVKPQCIYIVHMKSVVISNAAHHVIPWACSYNKYAIRHATLWLMIFVFHAFFAWSQFSKQCMRCSLCDSRKFVSLSKLIHVTLTWFSQCMTNIDHDFILRIMFLNQHKECPCRESKQCTDTQPFPLRIVFSVNTFGVW